MKPVKKISVIDQIVKELKNHVTSGKLSAGDKFLTEKEIGETLKVGRSSVREAIRILQALRYLEIKPGKGAFVANTDIINNDKTTTWFVEHGVEFTEYIEIRNLLESYSIRLAIKNSKTEDIEELESIIKNLEIARNKEKISDIIEWDKKFHYKIVSLTNNKVLISIYKVLEDDFSGLYREKLYSAKWTYQNTVGEHQRIFNAIKERDIKKGIYEIQRHLNLSFKNVSQILEKEKNKL